MQSSNLSLLACLSFVGAHFHTFQVRAQFLPTEVGTAVNGFQDDFEGAALDPNWQVVGQSAFSQSGGMLHVTTTAGDPNHLLYELSGYDTTVQEILARVRVTDFGTGDPSRAGLGVAVDPNTSQGINLLFRDEPNPGDRHLAFLDDLRAWGGEWPIAWENNRWYWLRLRQEPQAGGGFFDIFGKIWLADGSEPEPADWQLNDEYAQERSVRTGFAGVTATSSGGLAELDVDYLLIKAAGLPRIVVSPNAFVTVPVTITDQPVDQVVGEGAAVTFSAGASGNPAPTFQWFRNDVLIPGATNVTYAITAAAVTDSGAHYRLTAQNVVSNATRSVTSATVVLTVRPDLTAPTLLGAQALGLSQVRVSFSERMHPTGATNPANYTLAAGSTTVPVNGAALDASQTDVILNVAQLTQGVEYTLAVNHLTDLASAANPLAPNASARFTALSFISAAIGDVQPPGSAVAVPGGIDILAGGSGLSATADQAQLSYQGRTGDFDVKVRVTALSLANAWSSAGLIARESLDAGAAFAGALATPSISGSFFQSRAASNALSTTAGSFPVNYPNTWLRLRRTGETLTGYGGIDGQHWRQLGSATIPLPATVLLGLVASSHDTNRTTQAAFRDFADVTGMVSAEVGTTFEPLGQSSRLTSLVFSEIMYHPAARTDGKKLEFIELFNTLGTPEDISGYSLSGDVDYTFPTGTVMASGGFLVVGRNPADLAAVYGLNGVLGPFDQTNNLPNGSGTIQLRNVAGAILLEVLYQSVPPWPVAADGTGHSLVLAHASYGENDPRAWAPSDAMGGSPGTMDPVTPSPLRNVRINEFLAHIDAPELDYIELYNHSPDPVDISGCVLTDNLANNSFLIPPNTILPPRGFIAFNQTDLHFALHAAGETIYLVDPAHRRVLDVVRFSAQENGVAMGRYPDGSDQFYRLQSKSPGSPNSGIRSGEIVINELMYAPISRVADDQYVELYNRTGTAIDLTGWRLEDGISFKFPAQTSIPAHGYLVVGKNAAHLLARYPNLTTANALGDFSGKLSGSGERIVLSKPDLVVAANNQGMLDTNLIHVVVDEVTYRNGGRWGRWSDAGGSSLERIDAGADGRLASNWADSDETKKAPWTTISVTGTLDNGNVSADQLQVLLQGSGECLIDDVKVLNAQGVNQIANSSFESDGAGWTAEGTEDQSRWESAEGFNSSHSYHVRAVERGDNEVNRVRAPLASVLPGNSSATIQAKVRWLKGQPSVLLRLRGNWLEALGVMDLPAQLGTPGLPNSRAVQNAPPAITEVAHAPTLPAGNEPVIVTARILDPDGVAGVTLHYRIDPSATDLTVPMLDDGTGGDVIAGDGVYSATVPGQTAGTLVAFSIQAVDAGVPSSSAIFPDDAPARECLVRFGETTPTGNFPVYRLWMTRATFNTWSSRSKMNNTPLDVTFVLGSERVIYNTLALYAGSPYIAPGYNTPSGTRCGYSITFPSDDKFLGNSDLVLDWPGGHGSENTALQEQMGYWIANKIGLPYSHRYTIRLHVNGVTDMQRGGVFEAVNQPAGDFVRAWSPDDSRGDFFKIERAFEFSDGGSLISDAEPRLDNYTTTGGAKKTARYRWNWLKRSTDAINDYTNIFNLVDAVNATSPEPYTTQTENLVDLEEWMGILATEHIIVNFDAYGHEIGKNMYAYKPAQGKWQLYMFDLDWLMLAAINHKSSYAPSVAPLFNADDPNLVRMYNHPPFLRAYYRAIQKAVDGPLVSANCDPVMDAKYQSLVANGVLLCDGQALASPAAVKNWFSQRRTALNAQLNALAADFAITSNRGANFSTNTDAITLVGTAPIPVKGILVNGLEYPVAWTSVTNWSLRLALTAGQNTFVLQGLDAAGQLLPNDTRQIQVAFNGQPESPVGQVLINEIMYRPAIAGAGFVELYNRSSQTSFDLSGWRMQGVDFIFAPGTIISPGAYLVVAKDRNAFAAAYGNTIPIAGEFSGNLDSAGETLSLVIPGSPTTADVVVNSVTYGVNLPWPVLTDGVSLQRIDSTQEDSRVANWGADFVRTPSNQPLEWQRVTATGTASSSRLYIYMTSPGDVYLDDLKLVAGATADVGSNLIADGDFETGFPGSWTVSPNLAGSALDQKTQHLGQNSLHVVSTSAGTTQGSAIWEDVGPLTPNAPYTLSYWYLPSTNDSAVTIRLSGSGIVSTQNLNPQQAPALLSTPGAPNSVPATLPTLPSVWINEIEPDNVSGPTDNHGVHSPWVELYNAGLETVSLDGWSLTDQYTNLTKWTFPRGATISPHGFLLVWLDGQTASTDTMNASFQISPTSGSLALAVPLGLQSAVLDYVEYNTVGADRSVGLFPDGQPGTRQLFYLSTPAAPNNNSAPPTPLFINEWMAANTVTLLNPATAHFDDWFELYNPNDIAVDLTAYSVADSLTNRNARWTLPAGATILPRGFLLVWADGAPPSNGTGSDLHAPFKLNRSGEAIGLFAPNGAVVDSVRYGAQTNDVSQGRWPDGSGTMIFMASPTPRSSNVNSNATPRIQILQANLSEKGFMFSWGAEVGRAYRVQYKQNLSAAAWTDLETVTATSSIASHTSPTTVAPYLFFRIITD